MAVLPPVPGPSIDPIAVFAGTVETINAHNEWHDSLHRKANYVYDIRDGGAVGDGVSNDTAAIQAAIDAADSAGGGVVQLPPGDYLVDTIRIPGAHVALKGAGSLHTTFVHAIDAGPVVDFASWTVSSNYSAMAQYGGFSVVGTGADATEVGVNVARADGGAIEVARFDDIAVRGTGGAAMVASRLYLSVFRDCIFVRPDGIDLGYDVPYVELEASNGTRLFNCGFRSLTSNADAPSGMLRLTNSAELVGHDLTIRDCWTEYPHPAEVLIYCENNAVTFDGWSWFDMAAGTPTTAWVHIAGDGNFWRSAIPGTYAFVGPNPVAGIKVSGSRNRIDGRKGYTGGGGANVVLEAGAQFNVVVAAGQDSGTPSDSAPMVDDHSGNATNVLFDLTNGRALLAVLDGD